MRILLLCFAALGVGVLVGSMFGPEPGGRSRRAPEGARSSQDTGGADGSGRTTETRAGRTATGDEESPVNADVRTLTDEAAKEIERIRSNERVADLLAGEGTISGTVRDPSGEPVEGVVVTALTDVRPFALTAGARTARQRQHEDRDLATVAQDAIENELWRRSARRSARTGADGRFEITELTDTRHSLTAFHKDYDVKPLSQQGRIEPDAVVDFVASPAADVRIEVRMPDGSLADYAWLRWKGPHSNGWDTWMKESGKVRLPLGSCKLTAQTWLPEPMESEEVEQVISGGAGEVLVLELQGRRILTARLVLPEGFAVPRTVEYRLRRVENEEVDPESLLQDQSQRYARSRSPGRASWNDLEPGRYLVAAFLNRRRLIAHAIVEVTAGPSEVELQATQPKAGTYVTVKLLGPDGGPVPGQVSFRVLTAQPKSKPRRVDALQQGDAWLVFLDGVDPKAGNEATLRVGTRDFGGAMHPLRLRGGGTITIRFRKPARLKLQLQRYSGSDVDGSLFVALRSDLGADAWKLVAPDGTCELNGVQPGPYHLQLYVRKQKQTWPIYRRRVNLNAGDDELSIAVPALHSLSVRWAGKGRPRSAVLRCSDETIGTMRRDARLRGGVATFDGLAAGTYEIECARKRTTVRVPGPEALLE